MKAVEVHLEPTMSFQVGEGGIDMSHDGGGEGEEAMRQWGSE